MVASKFLQDKTYRNSAWAKISGLTTSEITYSEMAFLQLIDFKLFISKSTFDRWHILLTSHINQLMKTLPRTRCLPNGLIPTAYEPCNYSYAQRDDHFHHSRSPVFPYNTPSFNNLGFTSYGMNSKRNGLNEPTQPRKKLCQWIQSKWSRVLFVVCYVVVALMSMSIIIVVRFRRKRPI